MSQQSGGDVSIVTVQHFARVILVILSVPLIFFLVTGESVGSASGATLSLASWSWLDVGQTVLIAIAGMWLGRKLRLPAPPLIGPLILGGVIQASGFLPTQSPPWLLNTAQLVIGVGLGTTFQGISHRQLAKAFGLGGLTISIYLIVGAVFTVVLARLTTLPQDALFISFAPGGVTEMSLIALSLGIGPILVAAHHVFRISMTVVLMSVLSRRLISQSDPTETDNQK